jgi:hypothetical protein
MPHKFKVGAAVYVRRQQNVPSGVYEVIRQLPANASGEFEYQIKSHSEPHIRVAKESDLSEA